MTSYLCNRSLRPFYGLTFPATAMALILLPIMNAAAQTADHGFEGVRLFELAYYDEFDPVNALDLVDRTPGFSLEENEGGRGLSGVRSNVLIDGRRPPPKGQSIRQLLDEMPVDGIKQIELIDAGSRLDIDMQGFPQVINVITVTDRPAYYELVTEYQHSGTGDVRQQNGSRTEVEAIGTFSWNAHEFTVRGDTQDFSNESPADLVSIDPANPEQRLSTVSRFSRGDDRLEMNALFAITDESSLTFNGEARFEEMSNLPTAVDAGNLTNTTVQSFDRSEDSQDFSAEYRRPMGSAGMLMLALVDANSTDESESRLREGDSQRSSRNERVSGETAARIRTTQSPTDRITVRTTASSAFNFFEGGFRLFTNGIEVPVQGSANRVEENRQSVETSVDWNLNDRLSLSGTLGVESYEIVSRDLSTGTQTDPRGLVSLSFRPKPRTTLKLESRRDIGQLSFGQFLASANLSSEIVTAGASLLDPVRRWTHTASYDRRFGDVGVIRLQLTREAIDNPIRQVALSDSLIISRNTSEQLIDSLRASIDFPFERFGREDLILTLNGRLSDSQTIDPITGEIRRASGINENFWSAGLRRDPGGGRLAWGISLSNGQPGVNYSVRSTRSERSKREWETYVEWEPIDGLKLITRLEGPKTEYRESRFFESVRATGLDPSFLASTITRTGRSASVSVEWRRPDRFDVTGTLSTRPSVETFESLAPFGGAAGTLLSTRVDTTPRASVQFRFYN